MELSHRVVIYLSAQVQRQTNKTASEMLSSCLKFKSLPSLFNRVITTISVDWQLGFVRLKVKFSEDLVGD